MLACLLLVALALAHVPSDNLRSTRLPHIFGSDHVGSGWNAAKWKISGLPIVELTYEYPTTWTNPYYPQEEFLVADNLVVQDTPDSFYMNLTAIFQNIKEYQYYHFSDKKHSGFFHSSEKITMDYVNKYFEEDQAFLEHFQRHAWFKLTQPPLPPPSLHPKTAAEVAALPAAYDQAPGTDAHNAYMDFIERFGTHYVVSAVLGGQLKMQSWFHRCFLYQEDEHWVEKESGWSFFGIISGESGKDIHDKHIDARWDQYSSHTVDLKGGDALLFTPDEYKGWLNTVHRNMAVIDFDIRPIHDLILDSARSASLQQAVADYLMASQSVLDKKSEELAPHDPHATPPWCKVNWK